MASKVILSSLTNAKLNANKVQTAQYPALRVQHEFLNNRYGESHPYVYSFSSSNSC